MLIKDFALTGIVRTDISKYTIPGHVPSARKKITTKHQWKIIFESILRMIQTKTHLSALELDAVRDSDKRPSAKGMNVSVDARVLKKNQRGSERE